uniref:Uncharacterized protein n=1 Tax=Podoviridae sp. cttxo15 TaxID=2826584 RepID=A0A8S5N312_9CAUD|nr:MAG TPA: hypothetical protein [Podoviridae sp. cttxo15]
MIEYVKCRYYKSSSYTLIHNIVYYRQFNKKIKRKLTFFYNFSFFEETKRDHYWSRSCKKIFLATTFVYIIHIFFRKSSF